MKFIKLFKSNQEITDVSPNMLVYKEEANSNYTYPYNKYYKLTKDGIFYGDLTSGETLTDYYINYRQSSATDEGKLSIQKIKGNTIKMQNMDQPFMSRWGYAYCSVSASNGTVTLTQTHSQYLGLINKTMVGQYKKKSYIFLFS